jgi:hypothetical protein
VIALVNNGVGTGLGFAVTHNSEGERVSISGVEV